MEEIWKPIEGYEGLYEVSNLGNIKNVESNFIRKLTINKAHGYIAIDLYKDKIGTMFRVHRLVAKAFIENPLNKPDVNHKNKIRSDNRAENLEWVTKSENQKHAFETIDVSGENHHQARLKDSEIKEMRLMYANGVKQKELTKIFNIHVGYVSVLVNNKKRVLANG